MILFVWMCHNHLSHCVPRNLPFQVMNFCRCLLCLLNSIPPEPETKQITNHPTSIIDACATTSIRPRSGVFFSACWALTYKSFKKKNLHSKWFYSIPQMVFDHQNIVHMTCHPICGVLHSYTVGSLYFSISIRRDLYVFIVWVSIMIHRNRKFNMIQPYCWWKIPWTTWDVHSPVNDGKKLPINWCLISAINSILNIPLASPACHYDAWEQ